MTNYDTGRRFEHAARIDLHANGYEVIRSAGSKTAVDLVAFKLGQVLFVQAKRDGKISPAERTELLRLSQLVGALPIVAYKVTGNATVLYWRLTGPGPSERVAWTPDVVGMAERRRS